MRFLNLSRKILAAIICTTSISFIGMISSLIYAYVTKDTSKASCIFLLSATLLGLGAFGLGIYDLYTKGKNE